MSDLLMTNAQRKAVLAAIRQLEPQVRAAGQELHEAILPENQARLSDEFTRLSTELGELWLGLNINESPKFVRHSKLQRISDSPFRSQCPVCELGVLLVHRDQETFQLRKQDCCILCGQQYIYEDIGDLIAREQPQNA